MGTGSGDGADGYEVTVTSPDGDRVSCTLTVGETSVREELSAAALESGELRTLRAPLRQGHVEVTVQGVVDCTTADADQ